MWIGNNTKAMKKTLKFHRFSKYNVKFCNLYNACSGENSMITNNLILNAASVTIYFWHPNTHAIGQQVFDTIILAVTARAIALKFA